MGAAKTVFELGTPGPMRDRLVAAVLAGDKVATCSLLVQYEDEGESLPRAGDRRQLIDSSRQDVALVELLDVSVIRLGDADERLANDEGEGFRSVAEWRKAHEAFWRREVLPALSRTEPLDDDTRVWWSGSVSSIRPADPPSRITRTCKSG